MPWLLRHLVPMMLLASISAADAAPLVPPSDLPGRERYRFTPSPLDRFMQRSPRVKPLLHWDCDQRRLFAREAGRGCRAVKRRGG
jgi:hypothetical protein